MVQAIAFLLPASLGGTVTVFGVTLATASGLTLAGSLVNLGASLLISAALRPQMPDAPRPSNVQINSKSGTAARISHVGVVKVGGNVVFHRAKGGVSYRIVVHSHGEVTEILQRYLNNVPVEVAEETFYLDPQDPIALAASTLGPRAQQGVEDEENLIEYLPGHVLDDTYFEKKPRVMMFHRLGAVPETHYAEITDIWAEWTANHRLDGQCTTMIRCEQVDPEKFTEMYPNGEPEVQLLMRTAACADPRNGGAASFTENAALIIAHFMAHPDGFNRPDALDETRLITAANVSDQQVALAAGGTEARWRLSGSYALTERPQDVLRRMLDACSGRMRLMPTGKISLTLGQPQAGGFTLAFKHIVEVLEVAPGPDILSRFNVLPARYVDHSLGYVEVDAEAWEDAARIAADGEEMPGQVANLIMAPSHRQARAVMKENIDRENPEQTLRVLCKPAVLEAVYEDAISLDVPELGLTGAFAVVSHQLRFSPGTGHLETVLLQLDKIDPNAGVLALAEQGVPQSLPEPDSEEGVPVPQNVSAAAFGVQISQDTWSAGIGIAWDAPPSDALTPVVQYRPSDETDWRFVRDGVGPQNAQIGGLNDGASYDVRVAFMTPGEIVGLYVKIENVTASAVAEPPEPPTGLAVSDQADGSALIDVIASTSPEVWRTEIFRDGLLVASIFADPGEPVTFIDFCGAGTFDWTATAVNVSAVSSAAAGPVTQTIT